MEEKKFGGFVSAEQKKELIDFLEQHPELKSGKFTNNFTYKSAQDLWITLSNLLNSLPGAKKEWKQWRKTWSTAKRKNTLIKNHKFVTGGGPPIKDILTNEDEKIIEMIGSAVVEGDPLVSETVCYFDFDNIPSTNNCFIGEDAIAIIMEVEEETNSEVKIKTNLQPKRNLEMLTSSPPSCQAKKIKENATPSSQIKTDYRMDTPSTSKITENPINVTPPHSLEKKKKENVCSGSFQLNKESSNKQQSKKAPLRVQRFNKTQEANSQLLNLTSNRNRDKLIYSNEKNMLYKRDVEAKESMAKSLDLLVNYFN